MVSIAHLDYMGCPGHLDDPGRIVQMARKYKLDRPVAIAKLADLVHPAKIDNPGPIINNQAEHSEANNETMKQSG